MIRFSIKVGLAAGAVYYLKKENVWKESRESLKAYEKLNTALTPYIQEVKKQVPFDLPQIPSGAGATHAVQIYWNKGVMSTFEFLSELPGKVSKWSEEGMTTVMENPEMQKLFQGSPAPGEDAKGVKK